MNKKKVLLLLLIIPILYFGTGIFVCTFIDQIAFIPEAMDPNEEYQFNFDFEEQFVILETGDSISTVYSKTSEDSKGLILFLHGNSQNLELWAQISPDYHKRAYDVVMCDYPGFGKSSGKHSEKNLYATADKMYDWATERYNPEEIIIVGRSIGSIPASYLASKHRVKKVILETPLGNMGLLIKHKFPWAPVCKRLYSRFAVDQWLEKSKSEIHIIRSEFDELTTLACSENLLGLAQSHFLVEGAEHGNLRGFDSYQKRISELLLN